MKGYCTFIFIWLLSGFASSQVTTFQKTFGGSSIEMDARILKNTSGKYVIAARTASFGNGGYDIYLLQLDSNGSVKWERTFGGTGDDYANGFQETIDGGYIISGETRSFGAGNWDGYLIKTDSGGNMQWSKTFGGTDQDGSVAVLQTNDSGFIISGSTYSHGAGYNDMYLIKIDSTGNLQWNQIFGGTGNEDNYSVQKTNDNGFILTGLTNSFPGNNGLLVKTDSNGTLQWAKAYNNIEGTSIQQTSDSGFIIGCTTSAGAGYSDMCFLKTTSNGNIQWSKSYGGTYMDFSGAFEGKHQTSDGGFILFGNTYSFGGGGSDAYFVKTDSSGNLLWSKTFGGSSDEYVDFMEINGGFMGAGFTASYGTMFDIYLLKLDTNGNSGCNEGTPNTIVANINVIASDVTSQIQVSTGGIEMTPSTIAGIGGGITQTPCSTEGINEHIEFGAVDVFPNPTTGALNIIFTLKPKEVSICDVFGRLVLRPAILSAGHFDISELPPGVYFLNIQTAEGLFSKKVVKM